MEILTKLPFCKGLFYSKAHYCQLRNLNFKVTSKSYPTRSVLSNLEHFSDITDKWKFIYDAYRHQNLFQNKILPDFLNECGLEQSAHAIIYQNGILNLPLVRLARLGLLEKARIIDRFLFFLEPFPFQKERLDALYKKEQNMSLRKIRDEVLEEYLAWKFDAEVFYVKSLMKCFQFIFFRGRSLTSVKNNSDFIIQSDKFKDEKVVTKLFLANHLTFINDINSFKSQILGLNLDQAAVKFPNLMNQPYILVFFIVDILKEKGFSEEQILNGLPHIRTTAKYFMERLNYLLCSKFLRFRDEDNFLQLLGVPSSVLLDCFANLKFEELLKTVTNEKKTSPRGFRKKELFREIYQYLKITEEDFNELERHSKYFKVPFTQILETIKFLLDNDFTEAEIIDSITIILYPRKSIENAFLEINKNCDYLQSIGFSRGYSGREGIVAKCTKCNRKTLQLCLYFIEKACGFSGLGVHSLNNVEQDGLEVKNKTSKRKKLFLVNNDICE